MNTTTNIATQGVMIDGFIILNPTQTPETNPVALLENLANRVTKAGADKETIWKAVQNLIKQTSYCRTPLTSHYRELEEIACWDEPTKKILTAWQNRCHGRELAIRSRYQEDCWRDSQVAKATDQPKTAKANAMTTS